MLNEHSKTSFFTTLPHSTPSLAHAQLPPRSIMDVYANVLTQCPRRGPPPLLRIRLCPPTSTFFLERSGSKDAQKFIPEKYDHAARERDRNRQNRRRWAITGNTFRSEGWPSIGSQADPISIDSRNGSSRQQLCLKLLQGSCTALAVLLRKPDGYGCIDVGRKRIPDETTTLPVFARPVAAHPPQMARPRP